MLAPENSLAGFALAAKLGSAWADPCLIRQLIERKTGIYGYTVNPTSRAEKMREIGMDGVFTDNHGLLRRGKIAGNG